MVRRVGWGLADQALSSLTNFALGLFVVRSVDAAAFGAFSFAFAGYAVGLGVSRSIATQPLVIRYSATSPARWNAGVAAAGGVAVWVGALSALVAAGIAALAAGSLREAFLALAIVFPGLLLQDSWRYAFFAKGRDAFAFLNDLVWTLALVPAMWASLVLWPSSIGGPVLAWGGAATVAAMVGYLQARVWPRMTTTRAWLSEHRDLVPRYVGEFATTMAASQLSLVALGAIAGLAAAGTLRAAGLLLGPLNILFQGVGLVAIPEAVVLLRRSTAELRRFAVILAVVLAAVAIAWGAVLFILPPGIGQAILGTNWEPAHGLMFPLSLSLAGAGVAGAASVGLRALAAARHSFRANAASSAFSLVGGVGGAAAAAAPGVAWGQAIGNWVAAWGWWRELRSAIVERNAVDRDAIPAETPVAVDASAAVDPAAGWAPQSSGTDDPSTSKRG